MSRKEGERVLTSREREILCLIVDGKTNRQMAAEIKLKVNTVRVHRANIMAAVGIRKSTQLVVYAMRTGLVVHPGSSGVGITTPRDQSLSRKTGASRNRQRRQGLSS